MSKTVHPKALNPARLQQVVFDLEGKRKFTSLDELAAAVVEGRWAQNLELNAASIVAGIAYHKTITKVPQPPTVQEVTVAKVEAPTPTPPPTPAPAKVEVSEEKGAGRGRKLCLGCQKYVGIRTATCKCGYEFPIKGEAPKATKAVVDIPKPQVTPKPQVVPDSEELATPWGRMQMIWTPAGEPPCKLQGTSLSEVRQWAEQIRIQGFDKGVHYLVQALRYWARYFYDINGPEYKVVKAHLYELYPHEASAA